MILLSFVSLCVPGRAHALTSADYPKFEYNPTPDDLVELVLAVAKVLDDLHQSIAGKKVDDEVLNFFDEDKGLFEAGPKTWALAVAQGKVSFEESGLYLPYLMAKKAVEDYIVVDVMGVADMEYGDARGLTLVTVEFIYDGLYTPKHEPLILLWLPTLALEQEGKGEDLAFATVVMTHEGHHVFLAGLGLGASYNLHHRAMCAGTPLYANKCDFDPIPTK